MFDTDYFGADYWAADYYGETVSSVQRLVGRTVLRGRGVTTDWRRRYQAEQPRRQAVSDEEAEKFLLALMETEARAMRRTVKHLAAWLLQRLEQWDHD
jgi:hypothetical protein